MIYKMAASILGKNLTNSRVSAVLNKDVKQFGKKFLFDGDPDTCWNSGEGTGHWISLELSSPARVCSLVVQFQGGFVGKEMLIEGLQPDDLQNWQEIGKIYPDDSNKQQTFDIGHTEPVTKLRIKFTETTDFFSRIVIYHLDILGDVIS